jgi:hypothetical protein
MQRKLGSQRKASRKSIDPDLDGNRVEIKPKNGLEFVKSWSWKLLMWVTRKFKAIAWSRILLMLVKFNCKRLSHWC